MNDMNIIDYIAPEDLVLIDRAGESYHANAAKIILNGERGSFRSDADAELYIMNGLADLMTRVREFLSRIIADNVSRRDPSKGIIIVTCRDGRHAVVPFTNFDEGPRVYDLPTTLDTEDQARNLANGLWTYNGF